MKRPTFSFLICSERSGSNLLLSILNSHSKVCAPPPSHLFRLFSSNAPNYGNLRNDDNWHILLSDFLEAFDNQLGHWQSQPSLPLLDDQCARRHALEPVRLVYEMQAQLSVADQVFVKENHTAVFAHDLLDFFRSCRFVHMIRDPRDVAASYLATEGIPGGVERAVSVWLADQTHATRLVGQPEVEPLVCTLRYEDLLASPESELTRVLSHLDLEFESAMLDFHRSSQVKENVARVAAWNNLAQPIVRSNSGKFLQNLTEAEIEYIELVCLDLMTRYSYEPELVQPGSEQARRRRAEALVPELRPGSYALGSDSEREVRKRRLAVIDKVTSRRLK